MIASAISTLSALRQKPTSRPRVFSPVNSHLSQFPTSLRIAAVASGPPDIQCSGASTPFKAEPLRAAQHLGSTDRYPPELMTDLLRIYPGPLKAEQHDQRGKTRIRY